MSTTSSTIRSFQDPPFDIVSHIFELAVPSYDYDDIRYMRPLNHYGDNEAPINVSRVCRNWRRIALSCPGLWARVYINDEGIYPMKKLLHYYDMAIERALDVPLDVHICLLAYGPEKPEPDDEIVRGNDEEEQFDEFDGEEGHVFFEDDGAEAHVVGHGDLIFLDEHEQEYPDELWEAFDGQANEDFVGELRGELAGGDDDEYVEDSSDQVREKKLELMKHTVGDPAVRRRWRSVFLDVTTAWLLPPLSSGQVLDDMPELEELNIRVNHPTDMFGSARDLAPISNNTTAQLYVDLSKSPNLREFKCFASAFYFHLATKNLPDFKRLTKIEMQTSNQLRLDEYLALLSAAPALESLYIAAPYDTPPGTETDINAPDPVSVKDILQGSPFISLPCLKEVGFHVFHILSPTQHHASSGMFIKLLRRLALPSLESCRLTLLESHFAQESTSSINALGAALKGLIQRSHPQLKLLELAVKIPEQALIDILRLVPSLEDLKVLTIFSIRPLAELILPAEGAAMTRRLVTCPKLTSVDFLADNMGLDNLVNLLGQWIATHGTLGQPTGARNPPLRLQLLFDSWDIMDEMREQLTRPELHDLVTRGLDVRVDSSTDDW